MQVIVSHVRFHGIVATITLTEYANGWRWDVCTPTAGCLGFGGALSTLTQEQATEDAMDVLRQWYLDNVGPIGGAT